MARNAVVSTITILLVLFCFRSVSAQETHPRLIDMSLARCINCHEDLFKGRNIVHEPVEEDCTHCHEVSIQESGTRITSAGEQPAICVSCHDKLYSAASGELAASHSPVTDTCTICHDPHASTVPGLLYSPAAELCVNCHEFSNMLAPHSGQFTSRIDCLKCHLPHGSSRTHMLTGTELHMPFADGDCDSCHRPPFAGRVRLRARGKRVCTACHGEIIEPVEVGGSIHAPVVAVGRQASCISCHDPHLSSAGSLLVDEGTELCGMCHESVVEAARAETGHDPAAEACINCHSPHRSEREHLLKEGLPALCLSCHEPDGADGAALAKAHLGAEIGSLECTSCHTPHGAGNPKLLARTVHSPVVIDGCETCHEGTADNLKEGGGPALCLGCHAEIGKQAAAAMVPHLALEEGRCTDCHNPHASRQKHLIKAPAGRACIACHDEQAISPGEVEHGVIKLIGCWACHEPHGGENPKLLRQTGSELCLACHDSRNLQTEGPSSPVLLMDRFPISAETARGMATLRLSPDGERDHPVSGHRAIGFPTENELQRIETTFQGELGCLSCHDPHKGRSRKLLLSEHSSSMGSCLECHPK